MHDDYKLQTWKTKMTEASESVSIFLSTTLTSPFLFLEKNRVQAV